MTFSGGFGAPRRRRARRVDAVAPATRRVRTGCSFYLGRAFRRIAAYRTLMRHWRFLAH